MSGHETANRAALAGPEVLVSVQSVDVSLGRRKVLQGVSFTSGSGVLALVGPNGAGKTTLLRSIAGDLELDAGRVFIGRSLDARSRRKAACLLPQEPQLHPTMTSAEFVTYCGWLRGLRWRSAQARAHAVLDSVNLATKADDKVRTLSGGMKRRLALAATLISDPTVVLLDEPMAGLDPQQRLEVREVLRVLSSSITMIVATHVMQDLPSLTDRIVMLNKGRIEFDGDIDQFMGEESANQSAEALERAFVRRLNGGTS